MSKLDDNVNDVEVVAAEDILEAVHEIRHLYVARQNKASPAGGLDLTHLEGKVLAFFGRHPGATQRDLAVHSARDKGQVARLVAALKERGLLEGRIDEVDRRVLHLHVTQRGREARAACDRQRARLAQLAVNGLDAEERRELMALLRRVRDNIEHG